MSHEADPIIDQADLELAHIDSIQAEFPAQSYLFPTLPELFPQVRPGVVIPKGIRKQMIWTEVLRPDESGLTFAHSSITGKSTIKAIYFERGTDSTDYKGAPDHSLGGAVYIATRRNEELSSIASGDIQASDETIIIFKRIREIYAPFYDGAADQTMAQLIQRDAPFPRIDGIEEPFIIPKRRAQTPWRTKKVSEIQPKASRAKTTSDERPEARASETSATPIPRSGDLKEGGELSIAPSPTEQLEIKSARFQIDPAIQAAKVEEMIADILRKGKGASTNLTPNNRQVPTSARETKIKNQTKSTPAQLPSWAQEESPESIQILDPLELRILATRLSRNEHGNFSVTNWREFTSSLFGPEFQNLPKDEKTKIVNGLNGATKSLYEKLALLLNPKNQSAYALKVRTLLGNRSDYDIMREVKRNLPGQF